MAAPYTLLLAPKFRAFDLAGAPLSGGKVYIYEAGTTTAKSSYTTAQMAAANTWPVVLDSNGQADVWVSGPFKAVVTDADGVQLYTQDSLYGFGGIYTSMPDQDVDKLLAWGTADGTLINSDMTLTDIQAAVRAFNTVTMLSGGVVAAAAGDASAGVLDDKLLVSGEVTKSTSTDGSGVKRLTLNVNRPVGAVLYLAQACGAF